MTADERGLEGLRILLVASEIARSAPFDVVVSDIAIPVLDGYRLANQWRAARSWTPE